MARVYSEEIRKIHEEAGFMPFVCIIKWAPEGRSTAPQRLWEFFSKPEGKNVKGAHVWKLIGRDTVILIAWAKSAVSLEKFCTFIALGTNICIDVCPAVDQDGLEKALGEMKSKSTGITNFPLPKLTKRRK